MFIVKGNGIVWDAENNAPLFRFVNGEYRTSDAQTAAKAEKTGFTVVAEEVAAEEVAAEDQTKAASRKK